MKKWRINLGVRSERPPLGGAAAQRSENFSIFFQKKFGRSYMPPWSISYLNSSIGGCAPNCSTAGIFTSSMKIRVLELPFAPNTLLRFLISFDSMFNWVLALVVYALKLSVIGVNSKASLLSLMNYWIISDLPVPVFPVIKTGLL